VDLLSAAHQRALQFVGASADASYPNIATTMHSTKSAPIQSLRWVRPRGGFMSRDEFFGVFFILACINGLGSQIVHSLYVSGWADGVLSTFGISVIVWVAVLRGTTLILQEKTGEVCWTDLVLCFALLLLIALPIGRLAWFAITILSFYVLLFSDPPSPRRRGAIILLATSVPMLWSVLLSRYFANFILEIDASLIGLLLGTGNVGNVVRFADQSGSLVITPYCSSLANVSLAMLAWITISQWLPRHSSPRDLYWCFLAAGSVVVINVARISLMGLSQSHYEAVHNPWSDAVANLLTLGLTVGFCLVGVKRDFFSRV
jgi:exosortase/archaeosortase family protein